MHGTDQSERLLYELQHCSTSLLYTIIRTLLNRHTYVLHCLGHSKESVQSPCNNPKQDILLHWEAIMSSPNPHTGGQPNNDHLQLFIQYNHIYLLYLKAGSSTHNLRTCHAMTKVTIIYSWFQTFTMWWMLYSFECCPNVSILCADISEHPVCFIFRGHVNKKNNRTRLLGYLYRWRFGSKEVLAN